MKKESMNLAIYSCNWIEMDLKFKKLLLFTMMMNNANQLKIKVSPKKILDLQLFSNVLIKFIIIIIINTTLLC